MTLCALPWYLYPTSSGLTVTFFLWDMEMTAQGTEVDSQTCAWIISNWTINSYFPPLQKTNIAVKGLKSWQTWARISVTLKQPFSATTTQVPFLNSIDIALDDIPTVPLPSWTFLFNCFLSSQVKSKKCIFLHQPHTVSFCFPLDQKDRYFRITESGWKRS